MAKGRRAKQQTNPAGKIVIGAVVAVIVVGGIYFLSTRSPQGTVSSPREYVPVSGFTDVHGLAASPTDASVVYVATHHGLMRVENASIARVGTMQDDLMGFTMHPTNASTFWTSGHPRSGGNMGVRLSSDDGFNWQTIWSEKVDFHAMTTSPANPQHLWGYYAGELYESTDGGHVWNVATPSPPQMRSLTADPRNESTIYATTSTGISKGEDAGRIWRALNGIPAFGLAIDPRHEGVMYAGGRNALWKSTDGGATFAPLTPPAGGSFAYLSVSRADPAVVYAITYETGLYRSNDAGVTWTTIKPAT